MIFCPAIQDEKYGFRYLPFGVDTEIFKPAFSEGDGNAFMPIKPPKSIDAAFIGLLYPNVKPS